MNIVTTLLDHLYTNGIKMMFDSEFDTYDNILICIIIRETHIHIRIYWYIEFVYSSYYFYKTTYDNETLNYLEIFFSYF